MRELLIGVALGLAALATIFVPIKVRNELEMTRQYARQADALERIANALESKR